MTMHDPLTQRLLDEFQHRFPLTTTPYRDLAWQLGCSEAWVLTTLRRLQADGVISRVGPVFRPHTIGVSTLAALAVPTDELAAVAAQVSGYPEVNHNYEREHTYNLWFVITCATAERLQAILTEIATITGYPVLDLPMERDYHIDLGFPLQWN